MSALGKMSWSVVMPMEGISIRVPAGMTWPLERVKVCRTLRWKEAVGCQRLDGFAYKGQ